MLKIPITKRLSKDNYTRPKYTITEKLTKEDIEAKLEDYKKVDDINKVPIGTHLRYFILKDGEQIFRTGGFLMKTDGLPQYIICGNGSSSWSVQVKDTIFFKKLSLKEIKEDYQRQLDEKDDIIKLKDIKLDELILLLKECRRKLKLQK